MRRVVWLADDQLTLKRILSAPDVADTPTACARNRGRGSRPRSPRSPWKAFAHLVRGSSEREKSEGTTFTVGLPVARAPSSQHRHVVLTLDGLRRTYDEFFVQLELTLALALTETLMLA